MKKRILSVILLLLLLTGCREQPEQPTITESLVWQEAPRLVHGVLEYEKLTVQPWYCGRLEHTGRTYWAETELGYYYYRSGEKMLYYADKADLSRWVPVCGKPACQHTGNVLGCNARLGGGGFLIRDGRICFAEMPSLMLGKTPDEGDTVGIFSRALDGSDLKQMYRIKEAIGQGGSAMSWQLAPHGWVLNVSLLNTDGSYTSTGYLTTEAGTQVLAQKQLDERVAFGVAQFVYADGIFHRGPSGEHLYLNDLLSEVRGDPFTTSYRSLDGGEGGLEYTPYVYVGKYLSGNTLRLYRENDGYYDLELTTGQETFLCKAQLTDARCDILLPNCVLEYNAHRMRLFDGEAWREVEVPEELRGAVLYTQTLASDRILLTRYENNGRQTHLYQIMLDRENLILEYCGIL